MSDSSDESHNEQHRTKHGHHHHHHLTKKEKKQKQREKNRKDWIFFRQVEEMRQNVDIKAPERVEKPPERKAPESEKPWSAKLSTIRNRLDNSKRLSEDRWNRFAGTTDGGGRGR